MSWSGNTVIPSGMDREEAIAQIHSIDIPANPWNGEEQARHVVAAKVAAAMLIQSLRERVDMDFTVTLSGHAALAGQNWDSIGVSVGHTMPPPLPTENQAVENS